MLSSVSGCGFASTKPHKKIHSKSVELYYQNVRGLRTKINEFYAAVSSSNSDIFAITETGCNDSIQDAELIPPGYKIVRSDRADGRKQGGVCLVAAPGFELRSVPPPSDVTINSQVFEMVCAKVYVRERFLFVACVVYIPPRSCENEYMLLFRLIENFCSKYNNKIIVIGDFNLYSCNSVINGYFEYFQTYCRFTQKNQVGNCKDRQLDLVLSTFGDETEVCVRAADNPLVSVDAYHPPLEVVVRLQPAAAAAVTTVKEHSIARSSWNFYKANFLYLYESIQCIDWTPLYDLDLESSLDFFYDVIEKCINTCVPMKRKYTSNSKYRYPEWYTADLIRELKIKSSLHKAYKTSKTKSDYEVFSKCRAKVKSIIVSARQQYENRVQCHLVEDPKAFWNYVKSKRGSRNPTKILKDGQILEGQQCVREFAKYFHSVYSTAIPKLNVADAVESAGGGNAASGVCIDRLELQDVQRALQNLKPKRSSGPDGIPSFIFRDCRSELAEPLQHIYNLCLKSVVFPSRWKTTRVIPVLKSSLMSSQVEGYRPVAVLSTPAKIFESALHTKILRQVSAQLSDAQHGFRPARSTTSNLLNYTANILPTVDSGIQVDAAYFDFKKAFDLVDNDVLLKKLAAVGFVPNLLQFFASYLENRQQYVEYAGHRSEPYYTRSGVSQGSNLGPLQFILLVNDLPTVVQSAKCLLFADDLKLSLAVRSAEDCGRLQQDIDKVVAWSRENLLQFNTSKCVTITFSRARSPICHNYEVDGVTMARVREVRDLGVRLTTDLSFREHILNCCKKAYRNLGFLIRTVNGFTNTRAIIALYNALVRSHLECNAVVWAPHETKYIKMVERIQNKYVRYLYMRLYGVYPFYPLMYPTLFVLGMVGYNELCVRRDLALVLYLLKVLNGRTDNADILAGISFSVPDRYVERRRRPRLLAVPRGRTNMLNKAPLTRAINVLNIIANEIDLFFCSLSEIQKFALCVICYRREEL